MNRRQFISHVEGTQKEFRRFLVALCCGDSQLADDIAQDAYIKAYLSCDSFNNPDKFNSWIFRIGYNTFINHKRTRLIFSDYGAVRNITASDSSDSAFKYQDLYRALDQLSDKERTSVLLFYMEGYSIKQIADVIETSQEAVKQQLSRGRTHLRRLLSTF